MHESLRDFRRVVGRHNAAMVAQAVVCVVLGPVVCVVMALLVWGALEFGADRLGARAVVARRVGAGAGAVTLVVLAADAVRRVRREAVTVVDPRDDTWGWVDTAAQAYGGRRVAAVGLEAQAVSEVMTWGPRALARAALAWRRRVPQDEATLAAAESVLRALVQASAWRPAAEAAQGARGNGAVGLDALAKLKLVWVKAENGQVKVRVAPEVVS